jgi:hypothetical protein
MSDSPIPNQCFNCGKTLKKAVTFCPHCGAPLPAAGSLFKIGGRVLSVLFCIGSALVFGAVGACSMILGVTNSEPRSVAGGFFVLLFAALFMGAAIGIAKRKM